jgi:hypothetical protein
LREEKPIIDSSLALNYALARAAHVFRLTALDGSAAAMAR